MRAVPRSASLAIWKTETTLIWGVDDWLSQAALATEATALARARGRGARTERGDDAQRRRCDCLDLQQPAHFVHGADRATDARGSASRLVRRTNRARAAGAHRG